jgi:hypothetical protein
MTAADQFNSKLPLLLHLRQIALLLSFTVFSTVVLQNELAGVWWYAQCHRRILDQNRLTLLFDLIWSMNRRFYIIFETMSIVLCHQTNSKWQSEILEDGLISIPRFKRCGYGIINPEAWSIYWGG